MNFKTTVILLIVLALLGGLLIFDRLSGGEPRDAQTSEAPEPLRLLSLSAGEITALTITPADGEPLKLTRAPVGLEWQIDLEGGASIPADRTAADRLAQQLATMTVRGVAEVSESTGLTSPAYRVEIVAGDRSHRLEVGSKSAVGEAFVRLDDQRRASVVDGVLVELLKRPWSDYRGRQIVRVSPVEIQRMVIRRDIAGEWATLDLRRRDGRWMLTSPVEFPLDRNKLNSLVNTLGTLSAQSYVTPADIPSVAGSELASVAIYTSLPTTRPAAAGEQPSDQAAPPADSPAVALRLGPYTDILREKLYVAIVAEPSGRGDAETAGTNTVGSNTAGTNAAGAEVAVTQVAGAGVANTAEANVGAAGPGAETLAIVQTGALAALVDSPLELLDKTPLRIVPASVESLVVGPVLAERELGDAMPDDVYAGQPGVMVLEYAAPQPSAPPPADVPAGPPVPQATTQPAPASGSENTVAGWSVVRAGVRRPADGDLVNTLLDALASLQPARYLEPSGDLPSTPVFDIRIRTESGSLRLLVSDEPAAAVAVYQGVPFTIDSQVADRVASSLATLFAESARP